MTIIIPGRHHCLTNFQFEYLKGVLVRSDAGKLALEPGDTGMPIGISGTIDAAIFVVTSANHSNTRRNPLPFHLRALQIDAFARALEIPTWIYGVDDAGELPDFATYIIKNIVHESEGRFRPDPSNAVVVCSTPVRESWRNLGYRILPCELGQGDSRLMPWEAVEAMAAAWRKDKEAWATEHGIAQLVHPDSLEIWQRYDLAAKAAILLDDRMLGDDGDLTETRDYNAYVREMDEIADLKFKETSPFVKPGRIGDIGCAAGSWIRLACADQRLRESDFFGVEVSRKLYDLCERRKDSGDFQSPYVFFSKKNAVTGLVFDSRSMDTIHTSSLTHEIESYGSHADLLAFMRNRLAELRPGGVWVNRDVLGPADGTREVLLGLDSSDGSNGDPCAPLDVSPNERQAALDSFIESLSTRCRFERFAADFRKASGYHLVYAPVEMPQGSDPKLSWLLLSLNDAMEYLSRKDYADNWESEMRETFCFWSFADWTRELESAGFRVEPTSRAYTNEWIVEKRFKGKAELREPCAPYAVLKWPHTHMVMVASRAV